MNLKILSLVVFLGIFSFAVQAQNAKNRIEPLKVGEVAPNFTLIDQNGKSVTLSKVGKTTVLVFYRGYW